MNWLVDLFTGNSVAHTLIVYSLIIAIGSMLGKIRIKGISLGVTFVLFVGIAVGHFTHNIDPTILTFLKEFGLILFIFSVGLQVGPGFFASFKKGGLILNGLACLVVALEIALIFAFYYLLDGQIEMPMLVGILSGAVTNTPGLGAAEDALHQLNAMNVIDEVPPISLGYAVAYPIGVIGTILVMMLLKATLHIDVNAEEAKLRDKQNTADKPNILTFKITNPAIEGITLVELKEKFGHEFIATRVADGEHVFIPHADTILHCGNIILIVTRDANTQALQQLIGEPNNFDWKDDDKDLVSRRIVVTRNEINGKTIGDLHLRSAYNVNITRINRAGVDLLARPDLILQMGDRVMVVGPLESIKKAESILGNTLKRLNEPHIVTIFLGIIVGIVLGSVPIFIPSMPTPAKLGLAGGPLIVAILLGRFGYKLKLITYTTQSANLMLREIGICFFLASVGLTSGSRFIETVISPNGLIWAGLAACITIVPPFIVGLIARWMKFDFFTICGLVAGSHTNAPPLAYAASFTDNDAPAVAYSTVYPLINFVVIMCAQLIVLTIWN